MTYLVYPVSSKAISAILATGWPDELVATCLSLLTFWGNDFDFSLAEHASADQMAEILRRRQMFLSTIDKVRQGLSVTTLVTVQ